MVDTELKIKVNADNTSIGGIKAVEKAIQKIQEENAKANRIAGLLAQEYGLSQKETAQVAAELKRVQAETSKAKKEANALKDVFEGIGLGLGQQLTQAGIQSFQSAITGVVSTAGEAIAEFAEFEAALTEFDAKSDATAEQIGRIGDQAKELASITSQTPASVAALATALLSLGATANDVEANLEGITKLSDVLGEDPVLTGRVVQTGINSFGALGESADTITDKLNTLINTTAAGSAQGIEEFFQLFQDVGPLAKTLEGDFDQISAGFATLREGGFSASTAATGLKVALLRLSAPTGEAEELLNGLAENIEGIDNLAFNADGSFRGLEETLQNFAEATKDISSNAERVNLAKRIFGDEGATVILELLAEVDGKYAQVLENLDGSSGSLNESLETINSSLKAQANLLQGQISATLTEFGESLAPIQLVVVKSAQALLQAFNSLPAPIQKALVASTAFVGVLAAATAAIAAYNLANGQAVVSELAKSAALIKSNLALAAKTIATQAATVVQTAYAAATRKATAAQLAQTQALVAGAVTAAAFAGAIASIALVVDTFQKTTAAARELEQGTRDVEDALINLRKSGESVDLEVLGDEARQNAERLAEELGGVQNALDRVRAALGLDTAAEDATNRAIIAFGELSSTVGKVEGEAINLAEALQQGLEVDPSKLEASISAIESSIAALEAAQPVTEIDIQLKDAQIERLERLKAALDETANGTDELSDSTGDLSNQIKALTDDLQTVQSELEATALAQEAAIQEAAASGINSLEQSQRALAATEQQLLQDRISAARTQIAELEALKAGAGTPEAVAEINDQILQAENQLNRDRIKLAQQALDARTEAAEAAAKREADALKQFREDDKTDAQRQFDDSALARERAEEERSRRDEAQFEQQQADFKAETERQIAAFKKKSEAEIARQEKADAQEVAALERRLAQERQSEERAFQQEMADIRDRSNRKFNALTQEVERRIALEQAKTAEDRRALEERFAAEDAQLRRRREVEQEVLRDQGQVLRDAERNGQLDLSPLQQAQADLESELQAKEAEFAEQQQQKRLADEAQIQALREAQELQFNALREQAAQRIADFEAERQQQAEDRARAFEEEQRGLAEAFADAERDRERTFKDEQRRLDRQNAQDVAAILSSARGSGIDGARKDGGPVRRGGTYLVGEAGPELITPSRNGYVHSARETAALMNPTAITSAIAPGQFAAVSTRRLEQQMQTLIDEVRSSRQVQMSPAQYILQTQQPARDAAEIEMTRLQGLARRVGLG